MCFFFFFFNDTATTEIYTLSLHDALPILALTAAGARAALTASVARAPRGGGRGVDGIVRRCPGSGSRVLRRGSGGPTRGQGRPAGRCLCGGRRRRLLAPIRSGASGFRTVNVDRPRRRAGGSGG